MLLCYLIGSIRCIFLLGILISGFISRCLILGFIGEIKVECIINIFYYNVFNFCYVLSIY